MILWDLKYFTIASTSDIVWYALLILKHLNIYPIFIVYQRQFTIGKGHILAAVLQHYKPRHPVLFLNDSAP